MAILKPEVITQAWADSGTFVSPPATASTLLANQATGYPLLQSTKYSLGGIPVQRDQTNGAFNLYSSILAWEQAGGTFTFEPTVSAAYGGYNEGAMLAYQRTDGTYGLLFSTINSNTSDFITTPSVIGTDWKDVATTAFPNITDDGATGNVSIGVAGNQGGSKTILVTNPVDSNHQTEFFMATDGGDYTKWGLVTLGGPSNDYGEFLGQYADGGNGIFKPEITTTCRQGNYLAQNLITPAGVISNYLGFDKQSIVYSDLAANNGSVIHQYWDDSTSADRIDIATLTAGIADSGIAYVSGFRPFFLNSGSGLQTIASLMALGDIAGNIITAGLSMYFTLPGINVTSGGGESIKIQMQVVLIPPNTFATTQPWAVAFTQTPATFATYNYASGAGVRGNLSTDTTNTTLTVVIQPTDVVTLNPNGTEVWIIGIGV